MPALTAPHLRLALPINDDLRDVVANRELEALDEC
jgi:hypothetical protein